jgi:broad specificity phosphatase PhoE
MFVYCIRHGESETNRDGKWTGWNNPLLTEKGEADAKKAGEIIKNVKFDAVYASDLTRAIQTANIATTNHELIIDKRLREVNVGDFAGRYYADVPVEDTELSKREGYAKFNGESKQEFLNRTKSFLTELESSNLDNVAVFTHGGWLRNVLRFVFFDDFNTAKVCLYNCAVIVLEFKNGVWRLNSLINV